MFKRHLQDVSKGFLKTSSRRFAKSSSICLQNVFKTSCKNVYKTSSKLLQNVLPRHLPAVLQKHVQDIFKMSSRRFKDVLYRRPQCVFKTYHQFKLFLLTCLWDVFNTFLRPTAKTVIYRRICLVHTSEKFMISVKNLQEWYKFLKFYFFTLLHLLVSAYTANSWFEHIIAHFEYFFTGHHSKTVWLA